MCMPQLTVTLTADEVAEMLRVHPNTVRKWATSGRIPSIDMPGRLLRFRREDVERIFGASPAEPDEPAEAVVASARAAS